MSIIGSGWLIGQSMFLFVVRFGEYKTFLRPDCEGSNYSDIRCMQELITGFRYSGLIGASSKIPGSVGGYCSRKANDQCFLLHRAYLISGRPQWLIVAIAPML